jgi:hypothetical protein
MRVNVGEVGRSVSVGGMLLLFWKIRVSRLRERMFVKLCADRRVLSTGMGPEIVLPCRLLPKRFEAAPSPTLPAIEGGGPLRMLACGDAERGMV